MIISTKAKLGYQLSLALVVASEAFAAGNPGYEDAAYDAAKSSGGLPQLDPTWYASQLFWLIITFGALYLFFSKSILPALSSTIEKRHEQVQGDLDTAKDMRAEAERVHQAYEESLDDARNKATETFAKSEKKIKAKVEKKMADLREKAMTQTDKAEQEIAKAKSAALKDMDSIAAEVASEAAKKIVGISTDIKKAKTVIANINKKAA